jgi:hypothetical protein
MLDLKKIFWIRMYVKSKDSANVDFKLMFGTNHPAVHYEKSNFYAMGFKKEYFYQMFLFMRLCMTNKVKTEDTSDLIFLIMHCRN